VFLLRLLNALVVCSCVCFLMFADTVILDSNISQSIARSMAMHLQEFANMPANKPPVPLAFQATFPLIIHDMHAVPQALWQDIIVPASRRHVEASDLRLFRCLCIRVMALDSTGSGWPWLAGAHTRGRQTVNSISSEPMAFTWIALPQAFDIDLCDLVIGASEHLEKMQAMPAALTCSLATGKPMAVKSSIGSNHRWWTQEKSNPTLRMIVLRYSRVLHMGHSLGSWFTSPKTPGCSLLYQ
jgi:hypothetical protein